MESMYRCFMCCVLVFVGNIEEAKQEYTQAMNLCYSETIRNNIKDRLLTLT